MRDRHRTPREAIFSYSPNGMTYEEVGALLGITRERVRQILAAYRKKILSCAEICEIVGIEPEKKKADRCMGCDHLHDCLMDEIADILAEENKKSV